MKNRKTGSAPQCQWLPVSVRTKKEKKRAKCGRNAEGYLGKVAPSIVNNGRDQTGSRSIDQKVEPERGGCAELSVRLTSPKQPNLMGCNSPVYRPRAQVTGSEDPPAEVAQSSLKGSIPCQVSADQSASSRHAFAKEPSVEAMLLFLLKDIGKGFSISAKNQAENREACETLEKKLELLSLRTQALEATVGTMKEEIEVHKVDIQALKDSEQALQNKLEQLGNNSRRNNLRLLHVPEGVEGVNLKAFLVSLLKSALSLEESEEDIARTFRGYIETPSGKIKILASLRKS
ncbi:hypothetical protein NDU88_002804 [Pleurodeles waltl]|uniref:Uncharacterized protein n=1 Tax=Pleurodeles waltl TaxID=8319 RepID=A0AAV7VDI8_PLEWA|nr:hypothetical protein NDU88_002804 [Pleurodeles waltl]